VDSSRAHSQRPTRRTPTAWPRGPVGAPPATPPPRDGEAEGGWRALARLVREPGSPVTRAGRPRGRSPPSPPRGAAAVLPSPARHRHCALRHSRVGRPRAPYRRSRGRPSRPRARVGARRGRLCRRAAAGSTPLARASPRALAKRNRVAALVCRDDYAASRGFLDPAQLLGISDALAENGSVVFSMALLREANARARGLTQDDDRTQYVCGPRPAARLEGRS